MFAHIITYQGLHLPEREGRRYFHQRFVVAEHADVHRGQRVLLRVRRLQHARVALRDGLDSLR